MHYFQILFFILSVSTNIFSEDTVLCSKAFCDDYPNAQRGDPLCPRISARCNRSDSSSGKFMLSPTTCNCCEFCLGYLKQGESCSTGEASTDFTQDVCGPGLKCDSNTKKCSLINDTPCSRAQIAFDEKKAAGTLGEFELRPQCDEDGDFVPYHCVPGQICYCVNKNGERIFGETANIERAKLDLSCSCSRGYQKMTEIIGKHLEPGEYFRCTSYGKYEQLQCIDEKRCICVDEEDGAPTYPNLTPVEIWALSKDTLPCFNSSKHTKGTFYRKCEQEYMNKTKKIDEKRKAFDYVVTFRLPKCTVDGWYAPVQENEKHKYCANPDGTPIEKYVLERNEENLVYLNSMNCKCALAERLIQSEEKPACEKNGNYKRHQIRRGIEYIVDEDGNQIA